MRPLAALLICSFWWSVSCAQVPRDDVQRNETAREAFGRIRTERAVPALAGLLVRDGTTVERIAVGVRKQGDATAIDVDDAFHLGSDTKAMTATVVAILIDQGKLSWTSTLGELLPAIGTMDPAYRDVTVEMLLAHRAGLGSEGSFDEGRLFATLRATGLDPVAGRRMVAVEMLSSPPAVAPGSTFLYSNANYIVVGNIVETVTGRSWESLMRELLFEPLGMSRCGFGPLGDPREDVPLQPWAHRATADVLVPVVLDNPATLGPAGTVHCPLADWMKFVTLHLDACEGRPRLASAAAFAKLHAAYPGQTYTPGGWIRIERGAGDGPAFTHDGSNTLNYASVWWAPTHDVAIVAASNAGPPAGQRAVQQAMLVLRRRADQ